jgi:hypothetical protein
VDHRREYTLFIIGCLDIGEGAVKYRSEVSRKDKEKERRNERKGKNADWGDSVFSIRLTG